MSQAKRPNAVSELTKRLLFGSANHCAFPDCATPLVLFHGQLLSVNVEVAHIRSPESGGPRHVAGYGDVHTFENLLLLCGAHHHLIDQNPDHFSIPVLEQWKADQVAQMGQPVPSEILDALRRQIDDLSEASESRKLQNMWPGINEVRLVSGSDGGPGSAWIGSAIEPSATHAGDRPDYFGVEVSGLCGRREIDPAFKVCEAGLEFDIGRDRSRVVYKFENDLSDGDSDSEVWLARLDHLHERLIALICENQVFPARFRGFMTFDSYTGVEEHLRSEWVSPLDVQSWNELIKDNWDRIAPFLKSTD